MDLITHILTFLAEALTEAAKNLVSDEVKTGYEKIKTLIHRKFGGEGDVSSTLRLMEKKPDSNDLKECFREERERRKIPRFWNRPKNFCHSCKNTVFCPVLSIKLTSMTMALLCRGMAPQEPDREALHSPELRLKAVST
jgi:hypothetical protein